MRSFKTRLEYIQDEMNGGRNHGTAVHVYKKQEIRKISGKTYRV